MRFSSPSNYMMSFPPCSLYIYRLIHVINNNMDAMHLIWKIDNSLSILYNIDWVTFREKIISFWTIHKSNRYDGTSSTKRKHHYTPKEGARTSEKSKRELRLIDWHVFYVSFCSRQSLTMVLKCLLRVCRSFFRVRRRRTIPTISSSRNRFY